MIFIFLKTARIKTPAKFLIIGKVLLFKDFSLETIIIKNIKICFQLMKAKKLKTLRYWTSSVSFTKKVKTMIILKKYHYYLFYIAEVKKFLKLNFILKKQ